jgi:hypothetical protein
MNGLEGQDDEAFEVWYLSGWAWYLLGEEREKGGAKEDEETKEECWSEAKLCFENYLKVSFCFTHTFPDVTHARMGG